MIYNISYSEKYLVLINVSDAISTISLLLKKEHCFAKGHMCEI